MSRFKTFLALLGLIAVPVTYGLVTGWNPLPSLGERLSKVRSLASPSTTWAVRVGDQPVSAMGSGGAVVIFESGTVEGRDVHSGAPLWTSTQDWAAAAGSAQAGGAVVVLGTRGHGYRVVDALDGLTRWSEQKALGAWTFSDLIVDITCSDALSCTLRGRAPRTGAVRWQAPLTGNGRAFAGVNKPLASIRPIDSAVANTVANQPRPVPPLLGFRLDQRVQVYATGTGQRLRTYVASASQWVTVAGDRVLVSTTTYRGGSCRYSVSAQDPASGRVYWRRSGWDLKTTDTLGCDQRHEPVGGGDLVAAITPDGGDALLDLRTGENAYQVPDGQTLLATDGSVIVLRSADRASVRAVRSSGGQLWSREADRHATVALGQGGVLVDNPDGSRLVVVAPDSGRVLVDASTTSTVLGYADSGIVINTGRKVGLLPYGSVAP